MRLRLQSGKRGHGSQGRARGRVRSGVRSGLRQLPRTASEGNAASAAAAGANENAPVCVGQTEPRLSRAAPRGAGPAVRRLGRYKLEHMCNRAEQWACACDTRAEARTASLCTRRARFETMVCGGGGREQAWAGTWRAEACGRGVSRAPGLNENTAASGFSMRRRGGLWTQREWLSADPGAHWRAQGRGAHIVIGDRCSKGALCGGGAPRG